VTAVQSDVSKLEDLDRLYEVVRNMKGRVDIVFANAGVVDPVSFAESTPERFDKHFSLNARGAYFTVQKALPLLADKASIIISGSAAWQMGVPGFGAYSATKAALVSFVRTWTAELASRVSENDIDASLHVSHHFVEAVKILEFRDIALNGPSHLTNAHDSPLSESLELLRPCLREGTLGIAQASRDVKRTQGFQPYLSRLGFAHYESALAVRRFQQFRSPRHR
jgi:hypothetical protein